MDHIKFAFQGKFWRQYFKYKTKNKIGIFFSKKFKKCIRKFISLEPFSRKDGCTCRTFIYSFSLLFYSLIFLFHSFIHPFLPLFIWFLHHSFRYLIPTFIHSFRYFIPNFIYWLNYSFMLLNFYSPYLSYDLTFCWRHGMSKLLSSWEEGIKLISLFLQKYNGRKIKLFLMSYNLLLAFFWFC